MTPAEQPIDRDASPPSTGSGSAVVFNAPPPTHVLRPHGRARENREHREPPRVRGYDVLEIIGTGGMGVVYRARHRELRRTVALKTIRPAALADPDSLERFYAEAEAVARLQHPNIVQVFEIGTIEPQPGELRPGPFIALELVDGDSLARRTILPQKPQFVARIVEKLARAAHAAHRLGIIHRDLKPANVLLTRDGEPKIADFGLAKQTAAERDDSGRFVTQAGTVMGTPEYMAPEQAQGHPPTPAFDVYSLGVILYELLTARVPFHAGSPVLTMNQLLREEPTPPRQIRPELPRDLETICLKCLEKDPAKRYESAEALADDLQRFLDGRTIRARSVSPAERLFRWAHRNPLPAALTVAVVLVALIGLAGILLKWHDAEQNATAAAFATAEAKQRARSERWARYRADISASASSLYMFSVGSARRMLDLTPEEHRNWEWLHFRSRLDLAQHVMGSADDVGCSGVLSQHGRRVVIGSARGVRVWDTVEAREALSVPTTGRPDHIQISPDGRTLAYRRNDTEVVLHDVELNRVTTVLRDHKRTVHAVNFAGEGKWLVTSEGSVGHRLWDVNSGKLLRRLTPENQHVPLMTFSDDGRYMATCRRGERVVRLADADTGRERLTLNIPEVASPLANELAGWRLWFDGRGNRALTVEHYPSNVQHLWDLATGKLLCTMRGHLNTVTSADFSPDGTTIITASCDTTVRMWDAASGRELAVLKGHRGPVHRVRFSPDGKRLLSVSDDHTLRLWEAGTGELLAVLHGHTAEVHSADYTADGQTIVSAAKDGMVRLWDARAVEGNSVLRGHRDFVYGVAFHPDGRRVASASWDETARIWDATTGRQLHRLHHGAKSIVTSVAFTPSEPIVATRSRGAVWLWGTATGRQLHRWDVPSDWWRDTRVVFSRNGKLVASGAAGREVRIWDVASRAETARLLGHKDEVRDLAFSPDDRWLTTTGEVNDPVVRVWDVASGKQAQVLTGHTGCVYAVAFNHAGTLLASAALDGTVRLWDTTTWQEAAVLQHGIKIYGLAFTPDGTRLACACADGSVRLWDVVTRQEVAELRGHEKYVHQVAFSPDGTRLVTGSGDHTLRIWDTLSARERGRKDATGR